MTRLSPVQALISISVVDGVPLTAGEEFTGVIRTQDVRATEKDRVKIGDCFRGGDVVRGLVVSCFLRPQSQTCLTEWDMSDFIRGCSKLLHHYCTQ